MGLWHEEQDLKVKWLVLVLECVLETRYLKKKLISNEMVPFCRYFEIQAIVWLKMLILTCLIQCNFVQKSTGPVPIKTKEPSSRIGKLQVIILLAFWLSKR